MKELILTRGFVAIVDDEDYESLSKYKWSADKTGYAKRAYQISNNPKLTRTILMHRFLMGLEYGDKTRVDHYERAAKELHGDFMRIE